MLQRRPRIFKRDIVIPAMPQFDADGTLITDGIKYVVASRNKTDGSYTLPPIIDATCTAYGNRIDGVFESAEMAIKWITQHGEKHRLYVICAKQRLVHLSAARDAGQGWIVCNRMAFNEQWNLLKPNGRNNDPLTCAGFPTQTGMFWYRA